MKKNTQDFIIPCKTSVLIKVRKLMAAAICTLLTFILIYSISGLVADKNGLDEHQAFMDQRENFDVLFFGTSHVHNSIAPMELWDREGIVSYNLSAPGCTVPMMYWMLRCALEHTTPRVVVIDGAYISRTMKGHERAGYMHQAFDVFPFSWSKIQAGFDLYENLNDRMELIWPFSTYHSRWSEISEADFSEPVNARNGGKVPLGIAEVHIPEVDMNSNVKMDGIGFEYLRKIIELCQSRGIEVLLTYIPFEYSKTSGKECVALKRYAEEYDLNYLDGNQLKSFLDEATDFQNANKDNSHINWSGALKVSAYIGQYLKEQYGIQDRRGETAYSDWESRYGEYLTDKWETISTQKNPYYWLMFAYDRDVDVLIEMNSPDFIQDPLCRSLLENIGADPGKMENGTRFALISRDGSLDQYLPSAGEDTFFGKIRSYQDPVDKERYRIGLDGHELYVSPKTEKPYVRITLLYGEQHAAVGSAMFTYTMTGTGENRKMKAEKE